MVNKTTAGVTKEVQVCDVEGSRQKVKLGDFYDNNPDLMMDTRIYSRSQQAPSMTGKVGYEKAHNWYKIGTNICAYFVPYFGMGWNMLKKFVPISYLISVWDETC